MRRGPGPALLALAAALAPAAMATATPGCSYDWTVGAPAPGAGGGGNGSGSGGATGAGAGSGSASGGSGSASGGGGGAPDCAALGQELDDAREAAKLCTINAPGQCDGKVEDECGCASYVREPGPDTEAFVAVLEAFAAAGCTPSCSSCLADPGSGTCLYSAGMGPYCQP